MFVAFPSFAIDPESEEDPYFILVGEVEKAIAEERYDEAAARLIDALAVEPGNPGNLLVKTNLAMVYSALERDSLAVATLDDVISKAPNMTVALNSRGKLKLKAGNKYDAFEDFSRSIKVDSLNVEARYFRGIINLYGGFLKDAEKDFDILKTKYENDIRTSVALSALYSMTGRNREAIPHLKKLIKSEPAPEYYASLAGCYLAEQDLSEASSTIADGLRLYSEDPELYYYRAWLNRDRFRLDDAHRDAKLAVKFGASPEKVKTLFDKKNSK